MAKIILTHFKWLRNAYAVLKGTKILILLCPWTWYIFTNISQEHTACRFRDEVNTKNISNKAKNIK
jgi:hypothetical protein